MVILLCCLVAAVAIGFTLTIREKDVPPLPQENPELKHLENRKAVLYENLKDLQFEYHQGKLSDEDYESLKQRFQVDLAGVLASIDRIGAPSRPQAPSAARPAPRDGAGKRQPAAAPAAAPSNTCPACNTENPEGNLFCGKCGQPLGGVKS